MTSTNLTAFVSPTNAVFTYMKGTQYASPSGTGPIHMTCLCLTNTHTSQKGYIVNRDLGPMANIIFE